MKRVFGEYLKETRQVLGRIDFDQSKISNLLVVATEILESASEPEGGVDRRSECHGSQIVFAIGAAKSLLQIDVSNFSGRQFPLGDQFRPQH
jgi:hypothetical protein